MIKDDDKLILHNNKDYYIAIVESQGLKSNIFFNIREPGNLLVFFVEFVNKLYELDIDAEKVFKDIIRIRNYATEHIKKGYSMNSLIEKIGDILPKDPQELETLKKGIDKINKKPKK